MKKFGGKIFNYFNNKGYAEEAFYFMGTITIISIGVVLLYMNQFGLTLQQGFRFIGDGLKSLLNMVAYFDKKSPGVLSLVGTLIGAIIGFVGVILVFYLQGNYKHRQDKKRLMLLLLCIYENLNDFYISTEYIYILREYQTDPESHKEKYKNKWTRGMVEYEYLLKGLIECYKNMIYDKDWRQLIVTIDDIDEINFIIELGIDIESEYIFTLEQYEEVILKLKKLLKKHGYKKQVKYIDEKIAEKIAKEQEEYAKEQEVKHA